MARAARERSEHERETSSPVGWRVGPLARGSRANGDLLGARRSTGRGRRARRNAIGRARAFRGRPGVGPDPRRALVCRGGPQAVGSGRGVGRSLRSRAGLRCRGHPGASRRALGGQEVTGRYRLTGCRGGGRRISECRAWCRRLGCLGCRVTRTRRYRRGLRRRGSASLRGDPSTAPGFTRFGRRQTANARRGTRPASTP